MTKVIQRQRRHDHTKPGQPDRFFAKVAHVGVERLPPRHTQHNRAQNDERGAGVFPHEPQGVMRAQCQQHFGGMRDMPDTQHGNGDEPDQGNGAEELANVCSAALLDKKQAKENQQRQRNHGLLEAR